MNTGQKILEEIIRQPMFRMECPAHPESSCIAIWNGNAAEQIEAIAFDYKAYNEALTLAKSIHRSEFHEVDNWKPLDDTAGIISQIDNMYAEVRGQRDGYRFDSINMRALLRDAKNRLESIRETDKSGLHLDDDILRIDEALKKAP